MPRGDTIGRITVSDPVASTPGTAHDMAMAGRTGRTGRTDRTGHTGRVGIDPANQPEFLQVAGIRHRTATSAMILVEGK